MQTQAANVVWKTTGPANPDNTRNLQAGKGETNQQAALGCLLDEDCAVADPGAMH